MQMHATAMESLVLNWKVLWPQFLIDKSRTILTLK
jgi:hypothetical protein